MNELVTQITIMFIYILLGVVLKIQKKLPENAKTTLSVLIVNIMTPCTIVSSFLKMEINISTREVLISIGCATVMFMLLAVTGRIAVKIKLLSEDRAGVWEFMIMFSNNIFIGFPIIKAILGNSALVYASLICIPCNTLIFTYGLYLIGRGSKDYKFKISDIFNSCTFASVAAILLLITNVTLPKIVVICISSLSEMVTPLSLIVIGIVFAESFEKNMLLKRDIYVFGVLRLIVAPMLINLVLGWIIPDYDMLRKSLVITAALPASNIVILLCEKYGNNSKDVSKYVLTSVIFFVLTMPLINAII